MAARIAARRWVKAAWELPYIYISICLENNNPRGGRGEALAEPKQGGFLGGPAWGDPPFRMKPCDPMEGFLRSGYTPAGSTALLLVPSFPPRSVPRAGPGGAAGEAQ